jgi:aryl-alcohol dehydrogenase-like predicted oxidoreductase
MAGQKGITPAQLALAWIIHQWEVSLLFIHPSVHLLLVGSSC